MQLPDVISQCRHSDSRSWSDWTSSGACMSDDAVMRMLRAGGALACWLHRSPAEMERAAAQPLLLGDPALAITPDAADNNAEKGGADAGSARFYSLLQHCASSLIVLPPRSADSRSEEIGAVVWPR